MPDFLIESYDPAGLERPWPQGLRGLRRRRSILVPGDEVALHLVTASSAAAVRAALDRAAFAYDRVVEAVQVHPGGRHRIRPAADDADAASGDRRSRPTETTPRGKDEC